MSASTIERSWDERVGESNKVSKDFIVAKPGYELNFDSQKDKYIAELALVNKMNDTVLFRVRTTAAKSYIVVPSIGVLSPRERKIIKISMPFKEQIRERAEDKFLVQAFVYNGDDLKDDQKTIQQVFDLFHQSMSSKEFQNIKLKVHFKVTPTTRDELSEDEKNINQSRYQVKSNRNINLTMSNRNKENSNTHMFDQLSVRNQPASSSESTIFSQEQVLRSSNFRSLLNLSPDEQNRFREKVFRSEEKPQVSARLTFGPKTFASTINLNRNLEDESRDDNNDLSLSKRYEDISRRYEDNKLVMLNGDIDLFERNTNGQLMKYKNNFHALELKHKHQKNQLAKVTQEKEKYLTEINKLKLSMTSNSTATAKAQQILKAGQFELWQLLIVSTLFLILGSLLR